MRAIGIISLGMTFVIISGGIDLAVGSTLVAIGAVTMMLIDTGPKGLLLNMGITVSRLYHRHSSGDRVRRHSG
jgi:ribose transport system permease protein